MKVHVSVCFLLVCATFGLLAGADPIRAKFSDNIEANSIDEYKEAYEIQRSLIKSRFAEEIKAFPKGLKVYDDNGDLVDLSLTVGADGNESEDETKIYFADGDESEEETRIYLADRVKFHLYTRQNPTKYQELWINDKESLAASFFNAEKSTHFVTHGWINSANSEACTLIRDAYLENNDFNVIVVDWSGITMRPYIWASQRVVMVGQQVAKMINFLESYAELNTDKTTLVGHSLGAHVMGLAGYYAKGTINYIVGLDPALPMFLLAGPGSRISSEDANHVQIIHTNAGLLGYRDAIGHSDFYPNGGARQLGCLLDIFGACSHARSYKFFAESINSKTGFYGKPCKSYLQFITGRCKTKAVAVMGGPQIDFVAPGTYFLKTERKSLFAKGI